MATIPSSSGVFALPCVFSDKMCHDRIAVKACRKICKLTRDVKRARVYARYGVEISAEHGTPITLQSHVSETEK